MDLYIILNLENQFHEWSFYSTGLMHVMLFIALTWGSVYN